MAKKINVKKKYIEIEKFDLTNAFYIFLIIIFLSIPLLNLFFFKLMIDVYNDTHKKNIIREILYYKIEYEVKE